MEPLGMGCRKRGFLLSTGQVTQYGSYFDDGYYQKGFIKLYSVLTTGQYSGAKNIVINGKTDVHANNCVLDLNTGLMWSRYVAYNIGAASDGRLPWTTNVNGEGIFAFCVAANAIALSGYSDWRIPNVCELFSLMNLEVAGARPDASAFPGWPFTSVYTSTTCPTDTSRAFYVDFYSGVTTSPLKTSAHYCALVRG